MSRIFHWFFLCERWIPYQASTSILSLHYRSETVHCSTKDAYTFEITFLALQPCLYSCFIFGKHFLKVYFQQLHGNHGDVPCHSYVLVEEGQNQVQISLFINRSNILNRYFLSFSACFQKSISERSKLFVHNFFEWCNLEPSIIKLCQSV